MAHFAYNELGLRSMAAIDDGDPYTTGLVGAFTAAFQELGRLGNSRVRQQRRYRHAPRPQPNFGRQTGRLFFPLFPEEGSAIIRQAGQVAGLEDIPLIGGAALLVSAFLAVPESEGMTPRSNTSFGGNTNEATGKTFDGLLADYGERYGEPPSSVYLPHAYDATTMLLRAIEEVAVSNGETLYIDRARLRRL